MAKRAHPTPWTEDEAKKVEDILIKFNGPDSVCAVMGCNRDDLDYLCQQAFSEDFDHVYSRCRTVGETRLQCCLYDNALDGNMKAADMLARKYLDMKPGVRQGAPKKGVSTSSEPPERELEL